jgi:hypothetical protein
VFNAVGGTIVFRALNQRATTPTSLFSANQANGGAGGDGGMSLLGSGGLGGPGGLKGTGGSGGTGGDVGSGLGTQGSAGGAGKGGGLANSGTATFTGITVDFRSNVASGGAGGHGSAGAAGAGGRGGDGASGGKGGGGAGAPSADGGKGGIGSGGAIWIDKLATLTIDPRLGAKNRSKQSRASDTITANQAKLGPFGPGGGVAGATVGGGGAPNGSPGSDLFLGKAGAAGSSGAGMGGGVVRYSSSNVRLANTNINRNSATTSGNDMFFAADLE